MSQAKMAFEYEWAIVKDGKVVETWKQTNLIPTVGLNHMLDVVLAGATPITAWNVGLFEGNYTPVAGDSMTTFPTAATEMTAYEGATRKAVTFGAAVGGVSNVTAEVEFVATAAKTVYGGFLASSSAKGATTGVLASVVRFPSPKVLESGASLVLTTVGLVLTSA